MNQLFVITFLLLCVISPFFYILFLLYSATLLVQSVALCAALLCLASPFITYSLRTLVYVCYYIWRNFFFPPNPENVLQRHTYSGRVWISDIDIFLHMNNGRYRRAMDFARLSFFAKCGLLERFFQSGSAALMVAATARYRQALLLFQKYEIVTKLIYWDDQRLYFEQSFVSKYQRNKQFVYSRSLIAMKTLKEPPHRILEDLLGFAPEVPDPSQELQHFLKYNEACSESLKKEN